MLGVFLSQSVSVRCKPIGWCAHLSVGSARQPICVGLIACLLLLPTPPPTPPPPPPQAQRLAEMQQDAVKNDELRGERLKAAKERDEQEERRDQLRVRYATIIIIVIIIPTNGVECACATVTHSRVATCACLLSTR